MERNAPEEMTDCCATHLGDPLIATGEPYSHVQPSVPVCSWNTEQVYCQLEYTRKNKGNVLQQKKIAELVLAVVADPPSDFRHSYEGQRSTSVDSC